MKKVLRWIRNLSLSNVAFLVSVIAMLISLIIITFSIRKSLHITEQNKYHFYHEKAHFIHALIELNQDLPILDILELAEREFLHTETLPEDEFMCIVDNEGTIILHTKHLEMVGMNKSKSLILYIEDKEYPLIYVIKNKLDFLGNCITEDGEINLAAFMYEESRDWTIGIHRSKIQLRKEIFAQYKWLLLGYVSIYIIILPVALTILFRVAKRSYKEITKHQFYLEKAQEIGEIGTWEIDMITNKIVWTYENYKIFGISFGTEITYDLFVQAIHPDDRNYVNEQWLKGIETKQYDIEHRIVIDGKIKWVREKADFIFNEIGQCVKAIGVVQDISLRKKRTTEIKKLHLAVEQSANCIVITDPKGKIEYVNNKFQQLTGYTPMEVLGKSPAILKSGFHTDEYYEQMWEMITSGREWKGEIRNKKKNGDLYWENMTISPVMGDQGEIINFIAIKEDITEQKRTEQKILQAVVDTEEKERKRFAEDLHDELGPFLSGIKLYIKELTYKDVDYDKRISIIEYLNEFINTAVEKTRSISNELMPNVLTDYGLVAALKSFCTKINDTDTVDISFNSNLENEDINNTISVVLYRITIELINNTLKHALANHIEIVLNQFGSVIQLNYMDDGIGFDLDEELLENGGLGLTNIINRLNSIRGQYRFESKKGKGIQFNVMIDLALNL